MTTTDRKEKKKTRESRHVALMRPNPFRKREEKKNYAIILFTVPASSSYITNPSVSIVSLASSHFMYSGLDGPPFDHRDRGAPTSLGTNETQTTIDFFYSECMNHTISHWR